MTLTYLENYLHKKRKPFISLKSCVNYSLLHGLWQDCHFILVLQIVKKDLKVSILSHVELDPSAPKTTTTKDNVTKVCEVVLTDR